MAALTADRAPRVTTKVTSALPMNFGSGMKVFKGSRVAVNTATNYVEPARSGVTTLIPIGTAAQDLDLSAASASQNVLVRLDRPIELFWYDSVTGANAVSNTVGGGSFFTTVYMSDDHTVTTASSGNSVAGRVWDANAVDGVAVQNVLPADNTLD